MKRLLANVAVAVCAIAAAAERPAAGPAQRGLPPRGSLPPSPPSQQVPQFRSRVDLVHLDVSVLDQNRRPVKGLGPADFTVLENGVEQSIAAFSAVDMPDPEPPKAAWMREVAPDVRTNEDLKERRLFLIIIDDAATELWPVVIKNIRESAFRIIDTPPSRGSRRRGVHERQQELAGLHGRSRAPARGGRDLQGRLARRHAGVCTSACRSRW